VTHSHYLESDTTTILRGNYLFFWTFLLPKLAGSSNLSDLYINEITTYGSGFQLLQSLGAFPNLTTLFLTFNDFRGRILGDGKLYIILYIVMFIYLGLIEKFNLLLLNKQSCKI